MYDVVWLTRGITGGATGENSVTSHVFDTNSTTKRLNLGEPKSILGPVTKSASTLYDEKHAKKNKHFFADMVVFYYVLMNELFNEKACKWSGSTTIICFTSG